jgi:hypothetical protein
MYYYYRWKFISKWKYTTKHGIQCFYENGTKTYLQIDVELETKRALDIWASFYAGIGSNHVADHLRKNTKTELLGAPMVFFRPEGVFTHRQLGFADRKVYGISGWNWAIVGQGSKPIEATAFKHELSHIIYNNVELRAVSEEEAHKVFSMVGV